jgi:tRNA threonylcarbamoyl adenosine modification protein YeaZ
VHTVLIVAVDSATPAITAALAEVTDAGTRVLARRVAVDVRAHGELLAPGIDAVLRETGTRPADLAAVVAGVGPGPFTGLRVGLVTAAALADTLGIPAYGVGTLDALGWASIGVGAGRVEAGPGRVLVATDARRREVYWAVYAEGVRVAVGDGALRYAEVLGVPVRDEPRYPPAEGLVALAAQRVRDKAPAEPLTPLYLRRPDAVEPGARKAVTP